MATTTVTSLITRAAAAADMEDNFVTSAQWLAWATVEHQMLYSKIARLGFPFHESDESITFLPSTSQYSISEPLAVLAVYYAEFDGSYRKLRLMNPVQGQGAPSRIVAAPEQYHVFRNTENNITLRFFPNPSSGSAIVKNIPHPKTLVISGSSSTTEAFVRYPLSWEERIVLGMARRALAKEETMNPLIERAISDMDVHITESCEDYMMSDAHVIRNVRDDNSSVLSDGFSGWIFF